MCSEVYRRASVASEASSNEVSRRLSQRAQWQLRHDLRCLLVGVVLKREGVGALSRPDDRHLPPLVRGARFVGILVDAGELEYAPPDDRDILHPEGGELARLGARG